MSDQFDWLRPQGQKGKDEPTRAPETAPADPQARAIAAATSRILRGGSWFYWIAGLSLLNSAAYALGWNYTFLLGLGISTVVDVFAQAIAAEVEPDVATVVLIVGFVLSALFSGIFVVLGRLGRGGRQGVYVAGMALYALDALLFIVFEEWLSFGFHLFALYFLFDGFRGMRALKQIRAAQPAY